MVRSTHEICFLVYESSQYFDIRDLEQATMRPIRICGHIPDRLDVTDFDQ